MESPKFLAADEAVPDRRAYCRHCHKRALTQKRNPPGWYQVSVGVPREVRDRGYIWLGLFCSLACLALHMPELQAQDALTEETYERDPGEKTAPIGLTGAV